MLKKFGNSGSLNKCNKSWLFSKLYTLIKNRVLKKAGLSEPLDVVLPDSICKLSNTSPINCVPPIKQKGTMHLTT